MCDLCAMASEDEELDQRNNGQKWKWEVRLQREGIFVVAIYIKCLYSLSSARVPFQLPLYPHCLLHPPTTRKVSVFNLILCV